MENVYTLLIVDDEAEIREIYGNYFTKRGFTVDVAQNGEEGWAKLQTGNFDVALVDIKMPGMDGITLAQKVYDQEIDTEIIILTGHGDKDDAVAAVNAQVAAWFEKNNVDLSQVHERIYEVAQVIPLDKMSRILGKIPTSV